MIRSAPTDQLNKMLFSLRQASFKEHDNDYVLFMVGVVRRELERRTNEAD